MRQTQQNNSPSTAKSTDEYHVASLVAYAMKEHISDVQDAINAVEGAEIHATSDAGKIVFTLEGDSHKSIGKKMDILRVHKGLINLSPVYHQFLDESTEEKTDTKQNIEEKVNYKEIT